MSRTTSRFFAAAVLAIASCFCPAPPSAAAQASDSDRAWVLDSLKRYSPDGWYVVDTYVKGVPDAMDFMEYWDGPGDEVRWEAINTIVHETAHGYMRSLSGWNAVRYYVSPTQSVEVPVGQVYRTQEMVPSVPEALRTFRFSYVDSNEEYLGSQVEGAYGLLNEMTAYWVGTQAAADMLPLVEARGRNAPWKDYFNSVNASLYGILEFRFFVLRYLLFAQDTSPAVYKDMLANRAFRTAFVAVDRRSRDFVASWLAKKPALFTRIRGFGVGIEENGTTVTLSSGSEMTGYGTFMDIYELLRQEMARPLYAPILSSLYDGKTPVAWPDSGTPPAVAGGYDGRGSGGGGGGNAPQTAAGSGAGRAPTVVDPTGRVLLSVEGKDRRGDVKQPFVDLVKASVSIREDGALFRVELASLPEILPFDSSALGPGSVEYEWAMDLDLNGDGTAEYSISLSSYKSESRTPGDARVLERCDAQLWKNEGDSASDVIVPLKAALDGSAIVFTLNDSEALPLRSFQKDSFFTARTYFNNGQATGSDSMDL